ncbi:MAG: NAD(P)/FAD-dependent oxidoreductase [Deinococcales bacterium]
MEVAIVGGGPVGLLLACLLAMEGVRVAVLERRRERSEHSRSIGVHPPALEVAARAGVADALVDAGVRVSRGHAYAGRRRLGTLSFEDCPPPYPFVLTLPQAESERLLEARLAALAPGALQRGSEVVALQVDAAAARSRLADGSEVEAALVVGCDGHGSVMRARLGVPVDERRFPDRFVMGDFPDGTSLGADAAIYLTEAGVVESFPMPGRTRRWVAAVPVEADPGLHGTVPGPHPAAAWLADRVLERVGEHIDARRCSMVSAFGVQTLLAGRLVVGRAALAGDAAHVMPPFGGQGMNLGWLDAGALAGQIVALRNGTDLARAPVAALRGALAAYESARVPAARSAARRAAFNLRLGRAWAAPRLRAALVWAGLRSPVATAFARRFTMRGLEHGVSAELQP